MQISSINFKQNAPVARVSDEKTTSAPTQKPEPNNGKILAGLAGLAAVGVAGVMIYKRKKSDLPKDIANTPDTLTKAGFRPRPDDAIKSVIKKFSNSIEDKTEGYILQLADAFDADRAKLSRRMPIPPQISILSKDPKEASNIIENLAELTGTRLESLSLDPKKPFESIKLFDQKINDAKAHLEKTGQRTLIHLEEDTQSELLDALSALSAEQKKERGNLKFSNKNPLKNGVTIVSSAVQKDGVKDGESREVFWIYAKSAQRHAGMERTPEQIHKDAKILEPYLGVTSLIHLEEFTEKVNKDEAFAHIERKSTKLSNIPSKMGILTVEEDEKQSILRLLPHLTFAKVKKLNTDEADPQKIMQAIALNLRESDEHFNQKGVRTLLYIGDLDKLCTKIKEQHGPEKYGEFVKQLERFTNNSPQKRGITLVYTVSDMSQIPRSIAKNTECPLTGASYERQMAALDPTP